MSIFCCMRFRTARGALINWIWIILFARPLGAGENRESRLLTPALFSSPRKRLIQRYWSRAKIITAELFKCTKKLHLFHLKPCRRKCLLPHWCNRVNAAKIVTSWYLLWRYYIVAQDLIFFVFLNKKIRSSRQGKIGWNYETAALH